MASRYNRKNMLFCTFFHVQPKHQNGHIFVDIEGFRPYLSKPSYRAPKWALMVRLMQKERLKSPQKSPILKNQAIWAILAFFLPKRLLWPAISEPGWTRRKKVPLRVLLVSTRPSYFLFLSKLDPPEASQVKFSTARAFFMVAGHHQSRAGIPGVAGRLGVPAKTIIFWKRAVFFRA